jgi:hypothetical protein
MAFGQLSQLRLTNKSSPLHISTRNIGSSDTSTNQYLVLSSPPFSEDFFLNSRFHKIQKKVYIRVIDNWQLPIPKIVCNEALI